MKIGIRRANLRRCDAESLPINLDQELAIDEFLKPGGARQENVARRSAGQALLDEPRLLLGGGHFRIVELAHKRILALEGLEDDLALFARERLVPKQPAFLLGAFDDGLERFGAAGGGVAEQRKSTRRRQPLDDAPPVLPALQHSVLLLDYWLDCSQNRSVRAALRHHCTCGF